MNEIEINGNSLPDLLTTAIEDGTWPPPIDSAKAISPPVEDTKYFSFLSVTRMIQETESLRNLLERGYDSIYGLTNGEEYKTGLLNVDCAVVIAVSHSEDIVVLDYSVNTSPRVVAIQDGDAGLKWVEVAENFDAFLKKLKRHNSS